ncbi:NUDIX domain-containing protein [Billgrantia desiderata]|uniref:ADP-ribose pyrophosphatase n=1 Tax=Billgrantia desiderata TaxID=52021 RepID=A0AAW4YTV2_9GAMM|nr:NUDIX domain-containing protein [Halomonas desiderata]MCE8010550.1 NUDIX domain-containing protein [Halomonas desiderata]MCE8030659.1 NUDIX domain-containing protein [Halomonas desiderata]MCE8041363.1 NUDIX domain-containing protein [Halomonas desiderata]MCE8045938.1 NUDIX domain-containing protein [Halomonas desiderata]MCE8051570.1 NUDIX domain-containing protein [Halomonas desiderata]
MTDNDDSGRDAARLPAFSGADVELIERRCLHQGFFRLDELHLRHRLFEGGWSREMTREVHVRHDAVGVLLYDVERDCVALVEQIRAGALDDPESPWKLEIVAGLVEAGESAAEVARREAMEEAGCAVDELIELHTYYPSPGACTERVTLFCGLVDCEGLGGVHGLDEEHEDIRVHVLPFTRAWELLQAGRLDNAMCLIAFYWLAAERASLRARG